ncbi:MAG: hypothetical protein RIS35_2638 [Pseudomonadota bacterium]
MPTQRNPPNADELLALRSLASLVDRAGRLLAAGSGIASGGRQPQAFERRLAAEAARVGVHPLDDLLTRAEAGDPEAAQALRGMLTVKYSRMWREPTHWPIVAERLRLRMVAGAPVRMWSAACAHGEEAFTAAIVAGHTAFEVGEREHDWRILATDVDADALRAACAGRVSEDATGLLPEALRTRYMTRSPTRWGVEWQLRPELLSRIDFEAFDLTCSHWPTPQGAPFDVILLSNVLIYFDRPTRERILSRAAAALRPDGVILTGRAEGGMATPEGRLKPCGPCAYILVPEARGH